MLPPQGPKSPRSVAVCWRTSSKMAPDTRPTGSPRLENRSETDPLPRACFDTQSNLIGAPRSSGSTLRAEYPWRIDPVRSPRYAVLAFVSQLPPITCTLYGAFKLDAGPLGARVNDTNIKATSHSRKPVGMQLRPGIRDEAGPVLRCGSQPYRICSLPALTACIIRPMSSGTGELFLSDSLPHVNFSCPPEKTVIIFPARLHCLNLCPNPAAADDGAPLSSSRMMSLPFCMRPRCS